MARVCLKPPGSSSSSLIWLTNFTEALVREYISIYTHPFRFRTRFEPGGETMVLLLQSRRNLQQLGVARLGSPSDARPCLVARDSPSSHGTPLPPPSAKVVVQAHLLHRFGNATCKWARRGLRCQLRNVHNQCKCFPLSGYLHQWRLVILRID